MALFKMLSLTLRNLISGPVTIRYPNAKKQTYETTRGRLEIKISNCIFCGLCQKLCPTHAITVDREKKQWSVDCFSCITCGECVGVCPKKCLYLSNSHTKPFLTDKKS